MSSTKNKSLYISNGYDYNDQMNDIQDWIIQERILYWYGDNKEMHKRKFTLLQKIKIRLKLAHERLEVK